MIEPERAKEILRTHFDNVPSEEFEARREAAGGRKPDQIAPVQSELVLFQPFAEPLPLAAYLATALTGLGTDDRERLFAVSDVIEKVCSNVAIELYQPRKATDPKQHPDRSAQDVFQIDREKVLSSDLVIHVADHPSTGAGEELAFALGALIPVVLVTHGQTQVSRMVRGLPAVQVQVIYNDLDGLEQELYMRLSELRPILEQRRMAFGSFDGNIVGNRIRTLREEQGLTRDDVTAACNGILSKGELVRLEESSDRMGNPSLVQLRTLAAVLKTTPADLVEPDLRERVFAYLQEWLQESEATAARYGMSEKDENILLKRLLMRVTGWQQDRKAD